jgi:hypothetical protein
VLIADSYVDTSGQQRGRDGHGHCGGHTHRTAALIAIAAMLAAVSVAAATPQAPSGSAVSQASPRDAQGRLTIRATRLTSPLRIDGRLDEVVYASVEPVSDFIQMEPAGGQPASEKTDVWIFFDQRNVYVTIRAWESRPDLVVANEMRRDSNNIRMGDCVNFALDTFHDGRNAFQFEINPLGARTDGQSFSERQYSSDLICRTPRSRRTWWGRG